MNAASADSPVQKWTLKRWLALVAIIFAAHVALIFIFGARKEIAPRAVENVPSLTLINNSSGDWLALNNSTLFALPNLEGFAGPMSVTPSLPLHRQEWTEPPRWLSLPVAELGATFHRFMQTNRFANFQLEFQLPPPLAAPLISAQPEFAQNSTLQIRGEIAKRRLIAPIKLQSWPFNDVIAPSAVQVLVDAAGNVVSAVLLLPENSLETSAARDDDADQRALELARAARFAPLTPTAASIESNPVTQLSVGEFIFNWQTMPTPATNAP